MSEPTWTSLTIGGSITKRVLSDLMESIHNEFHEYEGPYTEKELLKALGKPVNWKGQTNYGEAEDTIALCETNNLTYRHEYSGSYEWNGMVQFWTPNKRIARMLDVEGDAVSFDSVTEPLIRLMMEVIKQGTSALPLFIHNEGVKGIVEECLKDKRKLKKLLEKKVEELFPQDIIIPPLILIKEK